MLIVSALVKNAIISNNRKVWNKSTVTGTAVLANEQIATQDLAQWHNLDVLENFDGAQKAGTQAQQFWQMIIWASKIQHRSTI